MIITSSHSVCFIWQVSQISCKSKYYLFLDQIGRKMTGVNDNKNYLITFSMIYLTGVPNFMQIWVLLIFGPNWPKNVRCQWFRKIIITSSHSACFIWQMCQISFKSEYFYFLDQIGPKMTGFNDFKN